MKKWSTIIYARCNVTGEIVQFQGPEILAKTKGLAHAYCQQYLGYCHVDGSISENKNEEIIKQN